MKTAAKRTIREQQGRVLILNLILLTIGGLILAPTLGLMSTGLSAGQIYEKKTGEFYSADAGVEDAINWLIRGRPLDWGWEEVKPGQVWRRSEPIQINGKAVDIIVESSGGSDYIVTATATGPDGGTTVLSTLWAVHMIQGCHEYQGPGNILVGDVYVTEDVSVTVNAQVNGNLVVGGELTLNQGITNIEGDVSVTGDVTLNQGSSITGNVCTDGDLTMNQNTSIVGDVFVGGSIFMYQNTCICGDVFILGSITMNNKGDIKGNVYAYNDISISLNHPGARIHGDVYSIGKVTVNERNRITGNIHEDQDPNGYPAEPPCPEIPANPIGIYTYEVLGYGG